LEEDERLPPTLPQILHRLGPLLKILLLVTLVAQSHVAEVGGRHERGMSRLRVRDAQRFVNVIREPRLVPELPGTPQVRGKLREQIVQAVQILIEIGRQLKQDGPELGAQLASRFEEVA